MEKNSGKGAWTGEVAQLGQSQGHSTRMNRLDEGERGPELTMKEVSQMLKPLRSSLGMCL